MNEIIKARHKLDYESDKYLRENGWTHTCDTPGSYWLWSKELEDGRTMLVEKGMAITLQSHMDEEREDCGDESNSRGA